MVHRRGRDGGYIMKLSEAILVGSTILTPKAGGQYFREEQAGCALGMAAVAVGCSFGPATRPVNENERRTLGVEGVWGQWILRVVMRPCECWALRVPRAMRIKDIVAHLFDVHVMGRKNWTLGELVAWVQTWEPNEISPLPMSKIISPRKAISPDQRVAQQQAEQEWQLFCRAFEARHKTWRSSSRIPLGRSPD
jgi:hypothetical protein